ncbi:hypothetical protein F4778DRAFT_669297 [Xylariomycetidae sp. FL2044]|nr:hypothetical protein F4778DRAFT_669297 [Xylariomycetidae sp. FL2044]
MEEDENAHSKTAATTTTTPPAQIPTYTHANAAKMAATPAVTVQDLPADESTLATEKENHPPSPQLPPSDDNSFAQSTRLDHDEKHLDSLTEDDVRAHLQDVESSFIPPISPIQVGGPEAGIDDTYLFDAPANQNKQQQQEQHPPPTADPDQSDVHPQQHLQHPAETSTTDETKLAPTSTTPRPSPPHAAVQDAPQQTEPEPELPDSQADDYTQPTDTGDTTASLENFSSSPTAAAAARTASRAISMASHQVAHDTTADSEGLDPSGHESSHTQSQDETSFSAAGSTLHHRSSDSHSRKPAGDAGSTPGHSLKVGKRPKYLRSRNASQRSSTSSFLTNDGNESDVTVGLGTDYAFHSGGAIPAYGLSRSISNGLSRSISMGSMASGLDELPELVRPEPLEPLEEVDSPVAKARIGLLATPKAKREPLLAPTDTVLARHVRNVEVPDSLAKEYKTKSGLMTPVQPQRKISDYTPAPSTAGRGQRNMTLREQSTVIERLSKENFDLKLKVMFLSDRLDKLSEEGIKEMISENVELKTSLAVIQRDNKMLRRRVKELEKRLRDEEDRPSTARSGYSSDTPMASEFDQAAQDREEEVIYLRERVEEYETEINRLRDENMFSQAEKRKLAETVKTMGSRAGERVGENLERQEEVDVYKALLEQETAHREQADDDNRKLREEIFRLRQEISGTGAGPGPGGMHHTTNIYNITRKARPMSPSRSRPVSGLSGEMDPSATLSQSSTLVEDLRRESEQLRHENAELRREVGAQTSMLTSRNREKERLYQEIEDLKLAQRRGGRAPSTMDSLLDRSASRTGGHERSTSRGSARTRLTMTVEDPEREELENKLAEHRDKVNELKFQKQELQRELESCAAECEQAMEGKRLAEEQALALQEEVENVTNDLIAIQAERDEVLQDHSHLENEFNVLQREAQEEIDALEAEGDQKSDEIQRLQYELQDRTENFEALQDEMRSMSEALIRLEDEQENKLRRIEQLELELTESNKEMEDLEAKLLESNEKVQRLSVQQESSQGEIAFLREEQEADKIRIGDLEAAIANAEQSLRDERERTRELDQRLASERKQREIVANREKEEATEWKERLMELESNLREALGDLNGTRSSLLKSIAKLQRELENTVRELDTSKSSLLEKDRIIKQRDGLLESHALESRRLAELLDKERQAHRNTKNQFETFERTNSHVSRTVTSQESRILDLETTRATDRKKIIQLETTFKEQLVERNNLLLVLWTRLSAVCGTDWAHDNSLINGRALPSLESVSTMLPGFSKNLLAAVKTIESMVGGFQNRIKSVERDLWKDYQTLETNLDTRSKKLERLETIVRTGIASGNFDAHSKIAQLETTCRALKVENATLQRANDARTRGAGYFDRAVTKSSSHGSREDLGDGGSPSPAVPTGPIRRDSRLPRSKTTHLETTVASRSKSRTDSITRSASNTGTGELERLSTSSGERQKGDKLWELRLRDLEQKLANEREGRKLDRAAARQRILNGEKQNEELSAELLRASRKNDRG